MPVRKLVADRLCRYEPFRRVGGRHPNVDDDELGLVLAHELEELVRVAGLADHPKTRPLEHARDALTEKDVVVGHHDPTRVVRGRIDRPSTLRGPACRPHTCCPLVRRDRSLAVAEVAAAADSTQTISGSADAWIPAAPRRSVCERRPELTYHAKREWARSSFGNTEAAPTWKTFPRPRCSRVRS
jgi:hypothetical protein